jgi:hypothetical protein
MSEPMQDVSNGKGICRECGLDATQNKELFSNTFMASGTICYDCYVKWDYENKKKRLTAQKMIEIEKLARENALRKFLQEVQNSMLIYDLDEDIRNSLPPVIDYYRENINKIFKHSNY